MVDYPNSRSAWKKRDTQKRGRELLSIFIVIVLALAILNGLVKTISLKKYLGKSNWDSQASFVSYLGTTPPAVFIFQKEPKRIALFKLDPSKYYFSGDSKLPLVQLSKVIDDKNTSKLVNILAISIGTDIENYIFFQNKKLDKETVDASFKDFASIATPFKILSGKIYSNTMSTNVSQKDLLLLWWQVKSLSINRLEIVDLASLSEEISVGNNQKVLGVDEESLHFKIAPYLENQSLNKKSRNVVIENTTDVAAAATLASQFVSGVGFVTTTINVTGTPTEKTKIVSSDRDNYSVRYLAKIFDCDIVVAPASPRGEPKEPETKEIKVILGNDFSDRYFK